MNQMTENAENASFAEALESSMNFKTPEKGDLLKGTIVSITGDSAWVTYGGPTEAVIDTAEIGEKEVGDLVEATVVSTGPELRISTRLLKKQASVQALHQAFENGLPVEGKISGRNKGGYDVNVGGLRAFCPLSQIDLGKIQDPDSFVGQSFEFRILELSGDARKFVISRAVLLKEHAAERAREARENLQEGMTLTGTVRNVVPFGAFVDLGGVEGLLHVSEMSHRRVDDPKQFVQVGDEITVKILRIEHGGDRISLSRKELEPDPWEGVALKYPVGASFTGKVVRKADFGLFVELEPGIDGLVHRTQLPLGMNLEDPAIDIDSTVTGWIREVDADRNRVSLAMREVAVDNPWEDAVTKYPLGRVLEVTVERIAEFGLFVEVEPGLTGLVPVSELDLPPGSDPAKHHHAGETLRARVLSVDAERQRMSLTPETEERVETGEPEKRPAVSDGESKGALAVALEKAFRS